MGAKGNLVKQMVVEAQSGERCNLADPRFTVTIVSLRLNLDHLVISVSRQETANECFNGL